MIQHPNILAIQWIITAVLYDGEVIYTAERGELTEERKQKIEKAREDGKRYGYELTSERFFFVEEFYKTDFPKVTKGPSMGTRVFDLKEILHIEDDTLPDTEEIANKLKLKTWN